MKLARWKTSLVLVGLIAFVFASRFVFMTSSTAMADSIPYLWQVNDVALRGAFRFTEIELGHPHYTWWCGVVYAAFRTPFVHQTLGVGFVDLLTACKIAGIIATAFSIIPFYWLARWLTGSGRQGLIAATFYTVLPLPWWWSSEIMSDATGIATALWAFGLLARWLDDGHWLSLGFACFVAGMVPLVRIANAILLPLFVALVFMGVFKKKRWAPLLLLLVLAVPTGLSILVDRNTAVCEGKEKRALTEYFVRSGMIEYELGMMADGERWAVLRRFATRSLGVPLVIAAVVGLIATLLLRWRTGLFLLAWSLPIPISLSLVVNTSPQIRYYLLVMPMVAVALAMLLKVIRRPAYARIVSFVLLVGFSLWHAVPDARVLHERTHALDATAQWYGKQAPPGSLAVVDHEIQHMTFFAHRIEAVMCAPDAYAKSWLPYQNIPQTMARIDEALRAGREAFVSTFVPETTRDVLANYYELTEAARLPGATVRNMDDPGLALMGEPMRRERDLVFHRLTANDAVPRAVPPPKIAKASLRPGGFIEIEVDFPPAKLRYCVGLVSANPAALDWTHASFKDDPLLEQSFRAAPTTAVQLDTEGRGLIRVPIPSVRALPPFLHVAFCVVENDDFLWASVPAPIPVSAAEPSGE